MKKLFISLALLSFGSLANAQYPAPYRNGLNGNGSYYSRGSSNYPSGTYYAGYRYQAVQAPVRYYPRYNYGYNPYRYSAPESYLTPVPANWWKNDLLANPR